MNVLTKVFVVLMTILSVVLVSLVVPFVANTENYKDQVAAAEAKANAAKADAALAQSRADASRSELNSQIDDLQRLLTAQRTLNDSIKGELATTRGDLERTRADLVRTQSDFTNLSAANSQFAKIQEDLQKELAARREETTKQAKMLIDLGGAVNDQSASTATLRRQLRLTQENLIKAQEELAQANSFIATLPQDVRTPGTGADTGSKGFHASPAINAQVADVSQAGETTLVQLNAGSAGGVKENMLFLVHRDGQYLGTVIVMSTDEQSAVGRVKTLKAGAVLGKGDAARSGQVN